MIPLDSSESNLQVPPWLILDLQASYLDALWVKCYKKFTTVIYKQASFALGKSFQAIIMFVGEARAYRSEAPTR